MERILILLFFLSLNYSCKFEEIKEYEKDFTIPADTIDIKHIKIETH